MGDYIYTNVQGPQPATLELILNPTPSGPGVVVLYPTRAPLNLNTLSARDVEVQIAFLAYHLTSARKDVGAHTLLNMTFSGEMTKQGSDISLSIEPAQNLYLRIRNGDEIIPCGDAGQALDYLTHALNVNGIRDLRGMYRSIYENANRIVKENPLEEKRT